MGDPDSADSIIGKLQEIVGSASVTADPDKRAYYSRDLFHSGAAAALVVAPGTIAELAQALATATAADYAVIARGGGLSYTGGYVPQTESTILFDTGRLDAITEINEHDLFVTAKAGCTWAALHEALAPKGLRIPSFGPASGRVSTVGGSLSQNSMFFGSVRRGSVADSLLSLDVVLADGGILRTGTGAIEIGTPFGRYNGPDLSGLFVGDGGAFGVKASATFRLERAPAGIAFASFEFPAYEPMIAAESEILRDGAATEILGLGAYRAPGFTRPPPPSLHVVTEGYDTEDAEKRLVVVRAVAGQGGQEIDPAIPAAIRGDPFGFMQSLLDAEGRLQVWTHGIVPYSRAEATYHAVTAYLDSVAETIAAHDIVATISVLPVADGFFVEPVLAWHDAPEALHREGLGGAPVPEQVHAPNPAARAAVADIREGLRDLFRDLGAAHFQIGKFYDYQGGLDPVARETLAALKRTLDPRGLMNPGVLGLS